MYVKRALIAAIEPPFLPRWPAAAYAGGFSLGRTAAAKRCSTRFSLRQTAAAPRCSAGPRCSIYSYHGRPLQHRGFSPWRTAAANRCSTAISHPSVPLQQTAAAFFFLTPAYRYSRLLQHGRTGYIRQLQQVAAAHWDKRSEIKFSFQHTAAALALERFSNAGVVCCSTCENSRVAPGES